MYIRIYVYICIYLCIPCVFLTLSAALVGLRAFAACVHLCCSLPSSESNRTLFEFACDHLEVSVMCLWELIEQPVQPSRSIPSGNHQIVEHAQPLCTGHQISCVMDTKLVFIFGILCSNLSDFSQKSSVALIRSIGRAAALGLKPLRLPRAPDFAI